MFQERLRQQQQRAVGVDERRHGWRSERGPVASGPRAGRPDGTWQLRRQWQVAMVMAVAAVAILEVAKAMEDVCVRICVGTGVGIQIGINISGKMVFFFHI